MAKLGFKVECLHIVGTENLLARVCDPVGGTQKHMAGYWLEGKKTPTISWNIWKDMLNCSA